MDEMDFNAKYTFRTFTKILFLSCIINCTDSDILDDYIRFRVQASCVNVDVCNKEVLEGYFNSSDIIKDSSCCSKCECDEDCFRRGDCCPDITPVMNMNIPPGGLYRCVHGRMKKLAWKNYLMIAKCLTNYTNPEVIRKCHEEPTSGLGAFIPVSNNASGDTYRNQYCAECNFEKPGSLTSWKLQLGCDSEPIKKITPKTLIEDVLSALDCDLYMIPPFGMEIKQCADLIDTCNETGLWQRYDLNLATGCELFRAPFYEKQYRNIFCYLCNKEMDYLFSDCFSSKFDDKFPLSPFSLLFDFNNVGDVTRIETKEDTCPGGTKYISYLDACFVTNCEKGFNYTDGECKPVIDNTCLEAFLVLQPTVDISNRSTEEIHEAIESVINKTSLFPINDLPAWDIHTTKEMNFVFHLKFLYNVSICRGLVEFYNQPFNITLQDKDFESNISSLFEIPFEVSFRDEVRMYIDFHHPFLNLTFHAFDLPGVGLTRPSLYNNDNSELLCSRDGRLPVLTQFIACLWIEVELKFFNVSFSDEGLYFHESGFTLPNKSFIFIDTGSDKSMHSNGLVIKVCVDDFAEYRSFSQQELDPYVNHPNTEELESEFLGYLTLVTSALSIGSSMFTFVTYIILKPLHTQPGVNNSILAIFIFFGHALFLFGSFYGYSKLACQFMGGLLHFFWLSVMLWYLVCSFHMFRVFHQSAPKLDKGVLATTLKYIMFVTVCSLCFIAINVLVSAVLSEKEDFGYRNNGGQFCWISKSVLLGLTITLPALLSVICSVVLFGIVVYRIGSGINVELRSNKNRQTFLIYIKLSVLTGITWLTIVPYIFTRLELFNYIFTCLNGLNGVFPMVAFLMNKRVYLLYKSLIFGHDIKENGQSSRPTSNNTARENIE